MQEEASNFAKILNWLYDHWELAFIPPLAVSAALFNVAREHFNGERSYTVREIVFINGRAILAGMMAFWLMCGIYPELNSNLTIFLVLYSALNSDKFFELILSRKLWNKIENQVTKKAERKEINETITKGEPDV